MSQVLVSYNGCIEEEFPKEGHIYFVKCKFNNYQTTKCNCEEEISTTENIKHLHNEEKIKKDPATNGRINIFDKILSLNK
jgi:hypothetical protein